MGFGAKFNPLQLAQFIDRKGQWVDWYRTQRCPCLTPEGFPQPTCAVCDGLGYMREEPKRIRVLLTGHNRKGDRGASGTVDTGSRSITPHVRIRLSEGDWIVTRQFPGRASEIVKYPDGKLNELFPKAILGIKTLRAGAVHEFSPTSYALGALGAIAWSGADVPAPGEVLSVEFTYQEAYQVHRGDKPMNRGFEDQRLPDKATGKLVTRRKLTGVAIADPEVPTGFEVTMGDTLFGGAV
jgi:hypothetical protein